MDDMKNAPFSSSCPQRLFEAVGRSESTIGFLTVITPNALHNALHMTLLHPPHPPFCKQQRNLQRSNIYQPSNIFQDSTSSNALHMTLLHPPTAPRPPFCKQQRNLQRSNIFQPSNIFQDSTSYNALHMTLLHPPTPPICIEERPFWYSIKTEGSSKLRGTPSLEPTYIYILYI